MTQIALANSFVDALAHLDASSAKRTAAFLDKLVRDPEMASLHPEIVHDASDRAIHSLRVSNDLRAIAHIEGDRLLLLYVDEHENAYRWARDRCVECHPVTGELQLVASPSVAEPRLAARRAISEAERIARGGAAGAEKPGLFDAVTDSYLLSLGVPASWLPTVREVTSSDMFLAIAADLPDSVADRLLRLATGELPAPHATEPDCRADARTAAPTWMCTVTDGEELCRLLDDAAIEHGLAS